MSNKKKGKQDHTYGAEHLDRSERDSRKEVMQLLELKVEKTDACSSSIKVGRYQVAEGKDSSKNEVNASQKLKIRSLLRADRTSRDVRLCSGKEVWLDFPPKQRAVSTFRPTTEAKLKQRRIGELLPKQ